MISKKKSQQNNHLNTFRLFYRSVFTILLFFSTSSSHAYIPPYWMIMSRVAENHGRGIVRVDQDVIFKHGEEPLIVNEVWTVEGENTMHVQITGKRQLQNKINMTIIYNNNKKTFIDENGVKKSEKIPNDWFEPFFHFRYSKNIKPLFVAQDIAPAESLKSAAHKYSQKNPLPPNESYLRLARTNGLVAYAVTKDPLATTLVPGVWIEQDHFNILKLRLKSGLVIQANDYVPYSERLSLPKTRIVEWNNNKVEIVINSVKTLPGGSKTKEFFEAKSLDFGKDPSLAKIFPQDPQLQEFYKQTR
jgi:hypothetical protein